MNTGTPIGCWVDWSMSRTFQEVFGRSPYFNVHPYAVDDDHLYTAAVPLASCAYCAHRRWFPCHLTQTFDLVPSCSRLTHTISQCIPVDMVGALVEFKQGVDFRECSQQRAISVCFERDRWFCCQEAALGGPWLRVAQGFRVHSL